MSRVPISLLIFVVVFCGKMLLHPAMPDTLQGREEFFAKGVNAVAPAALGPYASLTKATVDGSTLRLDVQMSPTAPKLVGDDAFRHGIALGTCKGAVSKDLIVRGGTIIYAFTSADGQALPSASVSSCPA